MAKVSLNPVLERLRGAIGDLVFKKRFSRTIVTRKPVPGGPPTESQLNVRQRFLAAVRYANSVFTDPARKQPYVEAAKARESTAFGLALGDFMNLPEVKEVDLAGYFGRVGDPIRVTAFDDFELTSVKVTIRNSAGVTLEQGLAVNTDSVWIYHATTVAPVDDTLTIEAAATDRAEHERTLSEQWHA